MAQSRRVICVEAVVDDAYDGVIRLLNDTQRFGYGLLGMAVAEAEGLMSVSMTLAPPAHADARLLAARLARHLTVVRVEAHNTLGAEAAPLCREAQAA